MNQKLNRILVAAGLLLIAAGASAASMADREFGIVGGGGMADSDLTGSRDDHVNPLIGLRYGQRMGNSTNFFGDLVYGPYEGDRLGVGDADVTTLRGGVEWLFSQRPHFNWFLSGALGAMNVNTDNGPEFTRPMASVGVGQAWEAGINDAFRWEVRADQSFGNSSLPDASLTNVQALLGYSWGIGAPPDSDGDGVANRVDQCSDTPRGARVDSKGCPIDADGDGVYDGLDQCPDTPAGVKVDGKGCPLDTDGDGVTDDKDQCPDTPKGDAVDTQGCSLPKDSDGDGTADDKDACPTVAAPGTADGCPPQAPVKKITLNGVHFDFDRDNLRAVSYPILDAAVDTLKGDWGDVRIEVAGHTDSIASDAYNLDLSRRRADTVRKYLVRKGIAADRLVAKGYGESQPIADNSTEEGRFQNRRVELIQIK